MQTVFITEQAVIHPITILEESKGSSSKVKFKTILQTLDDVNNNNRVYPSQTVHEGLKNVEENIKRKKFLGELDHPNDDNLNRQNQVMLKEASHVFTNVYIDGKTVYGVGETLSTPNGKIMEALIRDGIPIGFSLRALGNVSDKRVEGKHVNYVEPPLYIISYDCVHNPSHSKALIQEVKLDESALAACVGNVCTESAHFIQNFIFESELRRFLKEGLDIKEFLAEKWWTIL